MNIIYTLFNDRVKDRLNNEFKHIIITNSNTHVFCRVWADVWETWNIIEPIRNRIRTEAKQSKK